MAKSISKAKLELENQRIRINQVLMSKRNEYASWDEIIEEIQRLKAQEEQECKAAEDPSSRS